MVSTLNCFLAVILMVKVNSATRFETSKQCQSTLKKGVQEHLSDLVEKRGVSSLCGHTAVSEMESQLQRACDRFCESGKSILVCIENVALHMVSRVDGRPNSDRKCKKTVKGYYSRIFKGQRQMNQI